MADLIIRELTSLLKTVPKQVHSTVSLKNGKEGYTDDQ